MPKTISTNLIKLVNSLQDGNYHNGAVLAEKLNLSRNAIFKMVKKLLDYGIAIETSKGKGYRLCEPLVLLQKLKIKKYLHHKTLKLNVFESVSSTNDYFEQCELTTPIVCLAEIQTGGKGRLGRTWQSPFGRNIYLSCLYPFAKDLSELAGLSLVTSLALIKTLNRFGISKELGVKWPNDIFYQQQKLGGNLIEVRAESHGMSHCVIGIGLNVNMLDESSINQPWTSLRSITGNCYDRNELAAAIINDLLSYIERFNQYGFANFTQEWASCDCLMNQSITLQLANDRVQGTAKGINTKGHIVVALKGGETQAYSSGDAMLLKKA